MWAVALGDLALNSNDITWAVDTLVEAGTRIRTDSLETERSLYRMGADRSAARGLAATLLPVFDGQPCADAVAPEGRNVIAALRTLACSRIDEVRRIAAEALTPVWAAPCGREADQSQCRHAVALDVALAGAFDCQLGPWNPDLGRRDTAPLTGPIQETLAAVPTEILLIDRLTAAIVGAGGCVASSCCISTSTQTILDALLAAHCRGAAQWADKGYRRDDDDHRAIAAVLLTEAANSRCAGLEAHLDLFVDHSAALAELLQDFAFLATYDAEHRARFRALWLVVMDRILDAVASGHEVRGDHYFHDNAIAGLVPAPQVSVTDTDIDGTLHSATNGWPNLSDIADRIERWLPLAVGIPAAVDALIGFLRRAAPAAQAAVGLPWISRLVEGHMDSIAGRSITSRSGWKNFAESHALEAINDETTNVSSTP